MTIRLMNCVGRVLAFALIVTAMASATYAGNPGTVPEIDPASGASALALLAGVVLLARDKFLR